MDLITLITFVLLFMILFVSVFWIIVWVSKLDPFTQKKRRITYPSLSLLIPAYNEGKNIAQTIEAALRLKYPKPFEIIVLDDGSTDDTAKIAMKYPVRVMKLKHGGKARAMNEGIRAAKGKVIVTLDADSLPEEDALLELIPELSEEGVGAVTAALKVHSPSTLLEKLQWLEYLSGILLRKLMSLIGCLYIIPGPMSAYKKDVFARVGLFEEGNITEDTEMGLRLLYNGIGIANCTTAIVHTKAPNTINAFIKQRTRWYSGFLHNAMKYKEMILNPRHGDIGAFLPFVLVGFVTMFMSMGLSAYYFVKGAGNTVDWVNGWLASGMDTNYLVRLFRESLRFRINVFSLEWSTIFFGLSLFVMSVFLLWYAHKFTREKRLNLSAYIIFILIYYQFMGFVWLASVIKWLKGNKKW